MVVGELNAKHTTWGCTHSKPKGVTLLNIFLESRLKLETPFEPTHIPDYVIRHDPVILDIDIAEKHTYVCLINNFFLQEKQKLLNLEMKKKKVPVF